tara:strand:- start:7885 stop:8142 length:258 start_codon:yes stop_codon:yes gene_type:complete
MQKSEKGIRQFPSLESEKERLAKIELKIKALDKQLEFVWETLAPWTIWIDVLNEMESKNNVELYRADAEQFYPDDRDKSGGWKDI